MNNHAAQAAHPEVAGIRRQVEIFPCPAQPARRLMEEHMNDQVKYDETDPVYKQLLEVVLRNRRAQTRSTLATPAIDPLKVAAQARAYQDAERKAGREISATDAVAHIMKQGTR